MAPKKNLENKSFFNNGDLLVLGIAGLASLVGIGFMMTKDNEPAGRIEHYQDGKMVYSVTYNDANSFKKAEQEFNREIKEPNYSGNSNAR